MFGIVYNPILEQLWTAKKGFGAEHNGKKVNVSFNFFNNDNRLHQIRVSSCTSLDSALLIQEPWSNSTEKTEMLLGNLKTFIPKVRGCRAYGSAGINLSYLAMGAVDA